MDVIEDVADELRHRVQPPAFRPQRRHSEIPNARIIVQRAEWQAAHEDRNVEQGIYHPMDFDVGHPVLEIEGDHDVLGVSKVVCIPTPGHTP